MKTLMTIKLGICFLFISFSAQANQCRALFDEEISTPIVQQSEQERIERLSLEILRQVGQKKEQDRENVLAWLQSLSDIQNERPLRVIEHVTLLYILKSGFFEGEESPEASELLKSAISKSYEYLTGQKSKNQDYLSPLPARVLKDQNVSSSFDVLFHEALFDEARKEESLGQTNSWANRFKSIARKAAVKATWSSYFTTMLGLASLNSTYGQGVIAGTLMGVVQASMNEYMIHIGVGHATPGLKKFFRHLGSAGYFAGDIILAHSIHHALVKQDFGVSRPTPELLEKAEKIIDIASKSHLVERMIYEKYPNITPEEMQDRAGELKDEMMRDPQFNARLEDLKEDLRKGNFGVDGTFMGAASMIVTATPYYLLNFAIYHMTGNVAYLAASTVSLTTMILQSLYSHWHLHVKPSEANDPSLNLIQRLYMKTDIAKLSQRLHYTHHQLPWTMKDTRNGVIMAGSGWDHLSNDYQAVRVKDLVKMYFEGWIKPLQEEIFGGSPSKQ